MTTIIHLGEEELGIALDALGRVADDFEGTARGGFRPRPTVRVRADQAGRCALTLDARRRDGRTLSIEEAVPSGGRVPSVGEAARRWIAMLSGRDPSAAAAAAERLRSYREALVASLLPPGVERAVVRPGTRIVPPIILLRQLDGGDVAYKGAFEDGASSAPGTLRMGSDMAEALTDRDVAHATAFGPLDGLTVLIGVAPDIEVRPRSPQCGPWIMRGLALRPPGLPEPHAFGEAPTIA